MRALSCTVLLDAECIFPSSYHSFHTNFNKVLLLCNDITLEYFDKEIWGYLQKIFRMPVLTVNALSGLQLTYSIYNIFPI